MKAFRKIILLTFLFGTTVYAQEQAPAEEPIAPVKSEAGKADVPPPAAGAEMKTAEEENEFLSFVSLGVNRLSTWTIGTDYVDPGLEYDDSLYKRIEVSGDYADSWAVNLIGEFDDISGKFRKVFANIAGSSWGVVLEGGALQGTFTGNILNPNGSGTSGAIQGTKSFDGDYKNLFVYYRWSDKKWNEMVAKNPEMKDSITRNMHLGLSYREWETPMEFNYRFLNEDNVLTNNIDFVDTDLTVKIFGFGMMYDGMKQVHRNLAKGLIKSDKGFYWHSLQTVGLSITKMSDQASQTLQALYPDTTVQRDKWIGMALSGHGELGYYYARSVSSYNFSIQAGYLLRNIMTLNFSGLGQTGAINLDAAGEITTPDDMLIQHGPTFKFAMSF